MDYDFEHDGKRIEVKSARIMKSKNNSSYSVLFQKIKPEKHDLLILVLFAPDGLRFFRHSGQLTTAGVFHQLRFCTVADSLMKSVQVCSSSVFLFTITSHAVTCKWVLLTNRMFLP